MIKINQSTRLIFSIHGVVKPNSNDFDFVFLSDDHANFGLSAPLINLIINYVDKN